MWPSTGPVLHTSVSAARTHVSPWCNPAAKVWSSVTLLIALAASHSSRCSTRRWRTVKYEHLYLYDHLTVSEVALGLDSYFQFYNTERPHQSQAYRTPAEVHFAGAVRAGFTDWATSSS